MNSEYDGNSSLSPQGTDVLYVVPLFFVDEWKKFIRCVRRGLCPAGVGSD